MKTVHVNKFVDFADVVMSNPMIFFNIGAILLSCVIAGFVLKNT